VLAQRIVQIPGESTKVYSICYYREYVQAFTYISGDVDFTACPSGSLPAIFLEAKRLQNNLFYSQLYFQTEADFQGLFALYKPQLEITQLRLDFSIFGVNLTSI